MPCIPCKNTEYPQAPLCFLSNIQACSPSELLCVCRVSGNILHTFLGLLDVSTTPTGSRTRGVGVVVSVVVVGALVVVVRVVVSAVEVLVLVVVVGIVVSVVEAGALVVVVGVVVSVAEVGVLVVVVGVSWSVVALETVRRPECLES